MGLTKLTLQIGKKEIELSEKEARELKTVLEDLFGKSVEQIIKHEYVPSWRPYWTPYYYDGGLTALTSDSVNAAQNLRTDYSHVCLSLNQDAGKE